MIGTITLCNIVVSNAGGVICTALFFGLISGIFISTPPLLFMVLTPDKSKLGARMGIAYTFIGLSVIAGGPPAGAILQHDSSRLDWTAAWVYAGVLPITASLVFCGLRVWQSGLKVIVKV